MFELFYRPCSCIYNSFIFPVRTNVEQKLAELSARTDEELQEGLEKQEKNVELAARVLANSTL